MGLSFRNLTGKIHNHHTGVYISRQPEVKIQSDPLPDFATALPKVATWVNLVEAGRIILPLSAYHLIETKKAKDVFRRKRLAEVMATLSKDITIAPQNRMSEWEILYNIATLTTVTGKRGSG